jgi:drug/metabolite transporter (DMT)-like permease
LGYQIISILLYSLQNITNKTFARRFPSKLTGILLLDALAMSLVALILALAGRARALDPNVLLLAIAFGVIYILTIVTLQAALAAGPMGATILLNNIYIVFPVIYSILFFDETATVPKIIGFICMMVVTFLSAPRDKKLKQNQQALSLRWFLLTCATTLCNGALTILKRSLSWYHPQVDSAAFTFWGFLIVAIICWLIVGGLLLKKQSFKTWTDDPKYLGLCALGVGVATGGGNLFQLLALRTVPSIVVFPLNAGGLLIILWLYSLIVYKDKVRPSGIIALVIGLIGAILLSVDI